MAALSLELLNIVGPNPHELCVLITLNSLISRIKATLNKFFFRPNAEHRHFLDRFRKILETRQFRRKIGHK